MSLLETILASKRDEIAAMRTDESHAAATVRRGTHDVARLLRRGLGDPLRIVAEVKMKSPSAGALSTALDAGARAEAYARAGATMVSVLVDAPFFGGSWDDLQSARARVDRGARDVPLLAKEFVLDERPDRPRARRGRRRGAAHRAHRLARPLEGARRRGARARSRAAHRGRRRGGARRGARRGRTRRRRERARPRHARHGRRAHRARPRRDPEGPGRRPPVRPEGRGGRARGVGDARRRRRSSARALMREDDPEPSSARSPSRPADNFRPARAPREDARVNLDGWIDAYLDHLRVERALAKNTLDAYARDLARLAGARRRRSTRTRHRRLATSPSSSSRTRAPASAPARARASSRRSAASSGSSCASKAIPADPTQLVDRPKLARKLPRVLSVRARSSSSSRRPTRRPTARRPRRGDDPLDVRVGPARQRARVAPRRRPRHRRRASSRRSARGASVASSRSARSRSSTSAVTSRRPPARRAAERDGLFVSPRGGGPFTRQGFWKLLRATRRPPESARRSRRTSCATRSRRTSSARRRPPRGAGHARPRRPRHHRDLHARRAGPRARGAHALAPRAASAVRGSSSSDERRDGSRRGTRVPRREATRATPSPARQG